jgi:hypothetical protein
MAISVALRRFLGMGVAYSCSSRFDNYVRMQHFVRVSNIVINLMFPLDVFGGMCNENLCNVFLLLFMVL